MPLPVMIVYMTGVIVMVMPRARMSADGPVWSSIPCRVVLGPAAFPAFVRLAVRARIAGNAGGPFASG